MRTRRGHFFRHTYAFAAVLVLIGGGVVTALLTRAELNNARHLDQAHFKQLIERVRGEVTRRVGVYRFGMVGTRSVFAASDHVNRDEFIRLVQSRELETEFPGALGIGYIERVPSEPEAFDAFVKEVRADDAPWFEITIPPGSAPLPGAVTEDRYIIKYIEPRQRNSEAVGLDIGAHPVRREAAERAILVGDATLTGTIQLVQDSQKVAGFLYLLPHFRPGMPLDTPEQRAEALLGWVYMPMLGPKVFAGLDEVMDHELDIHVYDGTKLVGNNMIYDADGHLDEDHVVAFEEQDYPAGEFRGTIPIEIGGRTWTIGFRSLPSFNYASRSGAWTTGIGGGLLSLLLGLIVYMQGSSTRRAWAIAEGMTTDLRSYTDQATQATRAKSAFLANMSHEIRTPMTAILGFADLLRTQIDDDNEELLEHTRTIKRNGEHLLSVINDILDISKIEAGKLDIERIAVRPDAILREVLSLMQVKADEKKLPLTATLLTPIPAEVQSDPVRLRQVLVNLVGNAIKFTDAGGVRIEVRHDEPMRELKFAVVDTGVGMTDEQIARLFQAFEQADVTTTREFGGTGLGLHISQRLARMLGGQIVCNSEYGKGSTFTLTIDAGPLESPAMLEAGELLSVGDVQQAVSAGNSAQSVIDEMVGNRPPLDGLRILLAEDGKDNQRLINHHLTKAGARVTIVENGRLAVQALTVNASITGPMLTNPPFDLLITDMQMPEMDGYTAVTLLREFGCTLPIMALTAHAMTQDIDKCLAAGCDFYASKPIDKQKLIAVCRQAVRESRSTFEMGMI